MQTVDVLRHYHEKLPCLLEPNECKVDGVGLGVSESIPAFQLVFPMLDSRRLRSHEILDADRFAPRPHTLRSTEIGNATSGRNACAREDERLLRSAEILSQLGTGVGHLELGFLLFRFGCGGEIGVDLSGLDGMDLMVIGIRLGQLFFSHEQRIETLATT